MNESPLLVYPTTEANWFNENVRTGGMTLRDHYAGMAMATLIAPLIMSKRSRLNPTDSQTQC
ncbi:hypothetical protein [Hafnia paralvei]|uniref:hypothetical protein n=1 Tax=Hafnia paralvei TaxID=546367 RepID=UPI00210E5FB5|nr:hypothetical protein [Hafnia paralvei]MCQ4169714.1 hypothetical protein [Hafnia paralvei]